MRAKYGTHLRAAGRRVPRLGLVHEDRALRALRERPNRVYCSTRAGKLLSMFGRCLAVAGGNISSMQITRLTLPFPSSSPDGSNPAAIRAGDQANARFECKRTLRRRREYRKRITRLLHTASLVNIN